MPESGAVSVPSFEVTVRVPFSAPWDKGVNVAWIEQLALAASVLPQSLVSAKSPVVLIAVICSGLIPAVRTNVCSLLVLPMISVPNVSDAGETMAVALSPVPETGTTKLPALLSKLIYPDCTPRVVGVNVTLMTQLPPGDTAAAQVLV